MTLLRHSEERSDVAISPRNTTVAGRVQIATRPDESFAMTGKRNI
ncbi:MAG: hypothetical protein Q4A18_06315 [Rikenellaceae bacterium]|nr:hypothetical protein [Rikenellaceae bacterium]